MSPPTALVAALAAVVGAPHVVTDEASVAAHTADWTGRFGARTPAVVRPGSTDEVAGVVEACREHGAALVPQGGNTGLVGGGVPRAGEVVVHLGRLAGPPEVDGAARRCTAGAGTLLADVQEAAHGAGLAYGVDLGARGSATVGGTVATNAGGIRFVRWGGTRQQVAGVEAVLGSGLVVAHLDAPPKDNTGYDLAGLLCGSEGTLGIVTRVCLRLVERFDERAVALLGFVTPADALDAALTLRAGLPALDALELLWASSLQLVCGAFGLRPPFEGECGAYLLVECADRVGPLPALAAAVESLQGVAGQAVATDARRRAELWRYREEVPLAVATLGTPVKLDVSVAPAAQVELAQQTGETVERVAPGCSLYLFGHVGDGNLHVNVVPPGGALRPGVAHAVEDAVYRLVAGLGGSISAEHGIGVAKLPWLSLVRTPAELAAFRAVKSALDPAGICNPGVLLPAAG